MSWVNEILEDLGHGISAETCLREAAAAGYHGVELSRIFPQETVALSQLLGSHQLKFVSGWYSGFLAERDVEQELKAVHDHAVLLRDTGANVMVYGECGSMVANALDVPMSRRTTMPRSQIQEYGARLSLFATALLERYGLSLSYHHHLMTVAETLEETSAILAASEEHVGLLLDTGHAAAAGFSYTRLIEAFGDRINHIHLKDVRADILADVRAADISFNDAVRRGLFTIPGDGLVDFAPLATFLKTSGYSGWLVVEAEQDPQLAPPAPTVARAQAFVHDTIINASA